MIAMDDNPPTGDPMNHDLEVMWANEREMTTLTERLRTLEAIPVEGLDDDASLCLAQPESSRSRWRLPITASSQAGDVPRGR